MNIHIPGMNIHIAGIENEEVFLVSSDGAGQHGLPMVSTEKWRIWECLRKGCLCNVPNAVMWRDCGIACDSRDRHGLRQHNATTIGASPAGSHLFAREVYAESSCLRQAA